MSEMPLSPVEALGRVHGILEWAITADRGVTLEIYRIALRRPKDAFDALRRVSDPARLEQSDQEEIQILMSLIGEIPAELPADDVRRYVRGHGDAIRARICQPSLPDRGLGD